MATIYLDRMIVSASNGIFTFEDGDVQSIRFDVSEGARRVQGMNLNRATSGFAVPNRECSLSLSVFIRKGQAFADYLKGVDWSQSVSIQGMGANSGSGTELDLTTKITLINVIPNNNDYNFSGVGSPGTSSIVFYAEDFVTE